MTEDETPTTEDELRDINYGTLMNAARSASKQFGDVDIDTHAPEKDELVAEMVNAGIRPQKPGDGDGFERNGEEIDLLEVQTPDSNSSSTGPRDKTVLYCLTRAETTDERIGEIQDALAEQGKYEVREAGSGDKYAIVLPAENDPEQEHHFEERDDEEDEGEDPEEDPEEPEEDETDEESESGDESEVEEEDDDDEGDDEESAESESETDGEEDAIPVAAYRQRLAQRPKTSGDDADEKSVYEIAAGEDIGGRSSMSKDELMDAIIEAKRERGELY